MALRTLPFRQYSEEHDVINMFALGTGFVNNALTDSGFGDAGVAVTIESGNLNVDTITYDNAYASYLGKTDYPHVGVNQYPRVSLSLKPAISGDAFVGITLRQTAKFDENGEKLLYYPQKAEEHMAMLPGQSVPVATRGMFTLTDVAYTGAITLGGGLKVSNTTSGKFMGCPAADPAKVATVLATGSRVAINTADQFAGAAGGTGAYAIVGFRL